MANISLFSRILNGVQRQVDMSVNTMVVQAIQINGTLLSATGGSALVGDAGGYANFTPTAATVRGALQGIDTALAGVSGSAITSLTGDVTGTGPGTTAATVAFVGGSSAANVHSAELLANAATAVNTASAIVRRDSSGNFSAGTITASLTGHASLDLAKANNLSDVASAATAFANISPLTAAGDLIYENATPAPARLPIGSNNQILTVVSGLPAWAPAPATGVTSVALADASSTPIFGVSGSPVTSTGTLTLTLVTQAANSVFAGPVSGSAAQPSFRALVANDIPSLSAIYLPLAGGTMSGAINLGGFAPTNSGTPVNPNDLVNKAYVDNFINATSWKTAVLVATIANITLSGEQTIDGVLTSASRVLVKNQSTASQNGIYVSAAGAWSRSVDMNLWSEVPAAAVFVESGTVNADLGFVCTSQPGGTLGTTAINFVQFSSAGAYSADGITLQLISGVFSVKSAGISETQIASSAFSTTGAIVGGSGTKISVQTDGSTIDINGSNQLEVKAAGISATQLNTGAFDQVTITGGAGTPASVVSAPALKEVLVAGESFAATTVAAVRFALAADSGFVAGRVYKADDDTTTADNFYVIGLVYPGSSVSAAGNITVTKSGLINVPSHGFTPGLALWLTSAGGISTTAPSVSLTAALKVGIVRDANNIEVQIGTASVN